jgi:hypothetical protein
MQRKHCIACALEKRNTVWIYSSTTYIRHGIIIQEVNAHVYSSPKGQKVLKGRPIITTIKYSVTQMIRVTGEHQTENCK